MEPDEAPAAPEPQKPKRKRARRLTEAECHRARQLWLYVTKRDDEIANMIGSTVTAVKKARQTGQWADRSAHPWPVDKELDKRFLSDLKAAQDRFNESAFGAACDLMDFVRLGAKRLRDGAEDVPIVAGRGEDSLVVRLAAAPPLAQVFQTGRVVTGQSSDKVSTDERDWWESAVQTMMGRDDNASDRVGGEGTGAAPNSAGPKPD